jgi:hypothetical protein
VLSPAIRQFIATLKGETQVKAVQLDKAA